MGLTLQSTGRSASRLAILRRAPSDHVIALAGNPNVGKSTLFNALTGLHQHTGNWPGKTVASAQGYCQSAKHSYVLVDIPGAYSLMAHSQEEEVARNFLCFDEPEAVVVVCDATCLERNLNLVLQTLEITGRVIVCVNLMDEAKRKQIHLNLEALQARLGVPVIGVTARRPRTLQKLLAALDDLLNAPVPEPRVIPYPAPIEKAVAQLIPLVEPLGLPLPSRWVCLKLLENDPSLMMEFRQRFQMDERLFSEAQACLKALALTPENLREQLVSSLVRQAESFCQGTICCLSSGYSLRDQRIDRLLTSPLTGYPLMLLMLLLIFWLTMAGANAPSQLLSQLFDWLQGRLTAWFAAMNAPLWLHGALVLGVYRVLAWVVAVMLPPMAIFFPLFTLLEDAGYLPRIAFNLDKPFQKCCACGKQALCMAMGLGCNAAGVIGCRIIDSPRERLIAILTNSLIPCNGRFPTLIALISLFFSVGASSLLSAVLLTGLILLGIGMTFLASRLLSCTLLKGLPSSFTLELPPYRRPQIGRVLIRSLLDRTLVVLGRAVTVAAPAGLIIWLMANVTINSQSVLSHCAAFLDPLGRLLGLDGVILMAFILGFPANEIVVPIMLMAYLAQGTLVDADLTAMKALLLENGWTWVTALCMMIFSLFHWPCSTTLLTIRKETQSWKWTALAALLPTLIGMVLCIIINLLAHL
ncbi:MAG: ferrous iron transport protein B [Clostridia bacterium]|nr:ferrous iron transport protein B [Clostridia bacterium]